jgi:6-phosphogluconolactonase
MPQPDIQTFSSPAALAAAAARAWLEELTGRSASAPPCSVALSGGRITKAFFQSIVGQARDNRSILDNVHFFWADERCVPADDPESNFRMADELLFRPLGIAPERLHRIHGELSPDEGAAAARVDLDRFRHLKGADLPLFDTVFLGMGEDGHVASLFPGESEEDMKNPATYRNVVAVKPPPHRITLGYDAIVSANSVTALVSGSGKESALRDSLSPEGTTPLARIIQCRREIRILTDVKLEGD